MNSERAHVQRRTSTVKSNKEVWLGEPVRTRFLYLCAFTFCWQFAVWFLATGWMPNR